MKKRVLSLILVTCCIFGLVACKDEKKSEKEDKESKEETTQESGAAVEESESDSDSKSVTQEYLLSSGYDADMLYTFDENGNKLKTFDVKKINGYLDKAGYKSEFANSRCAADDIVYVYYSDYDDENTTFLAVDYKSGKVEPIKGLLDGVSTATCYCYNGKIYASAYDYDAKKYLERVYEKDANGLSFKDVKDEELALEKHDVLYNRDGRPSIASRMFDDIGFALVEVRTDDKRNGIGKYTEDGKVKVVEGFKVDGFTSQCYNKNYFVYSRYDDETFEDEGFYVYDFKNDSTAELNIPVDASVIGMIDNTFYYQVNEIENGEASLDYQLYAYDLDKNDNKKLYTIKNVPGAGSIFSYTVVLGNSIYVAAVDDTQLKYYKLDDKGKKKDLDCPIRTYSAFEYGSVISDYNEVKCIYCDATVYTTYQEAFVLDDKYSPYAQQINAALKEKLDAAMAYSPEFNEDECEYHQDESACESDDGGVTGVKIINDNYLIVDMDSYWYGGGAHGMPGMCEYIFDLTTGEELTFADFYSGTEEELKNLVATKVKEDYERRKAEGEETYYFAETADEIYDTAYEYTTLENANILFGEDKVTYYFYPYDLASYADGFQYFDFTYEEILGTSALTR